MYLTTHALFGKKIVVAQLMTLLLSFLEHMQYFLKESDIWTILHQN